MSGRRAGAGAGTLDAVALAPRPREPRPGPPPRDLGPGAGARVVPERRGGPWRRPCPFAGRLAASRVWSPRDGHRRAHFAAGKPRLGGGAGPRAAASGRARLRSARAPEAGPFPTGRRARAPPGRGAGSARGGPPAAFPPGGPEAGPPSPRATRNAASSRRERPHRTRRSRRPDSGESGGARPGVTSAGSAARCWGAGAPSGGTRLLLGGEAGGRVTLQATFGTGLFGGAPAGVRLLTPGPASRGRPALPAGHTAPAALGLPAQPVALPPTRPFQRSPCPVLVSPGPRRAPLRQALGEMAALGGCQQPPRAPSPVSLKSPGTPGACRPEAQLRSHSRQHGTASPTHRRPPGAGTVGAGG